MRWYANLWDLPGGHVEPGETERQAVVREVSEELGVAISEPTGEAATRLFDYDSAGTRTADLSVWIVTDWTGNITNNSPREHLELRWFTPDELASVKLAHPEYVAFLTDVLRMYF
jgi:8-oxo-dGTP diphosphatase